MNKFTKLLLLLCVEILLVIFFLSVSENSDLVIVILFPPLFAITLYFLIFTTFEVDHKSKKVHLIFALLLGSIALFSSSIGVHYTANEINNEFLQEIGIDNFIDKLYFLDEQFSHWLTLAGVFGILSSIILWIYFKTRHRLNNVDKEIKEQTTLMDVFIMSFFGSLIGAVLALGAIEANITKHSLIVVSLFMPFLFFKYRKYSLAKTGRDTMIFVFSSFSSFIAVGVAYNLIKISGFLS